ncbi:MAG TPA: extracellular solute-binding protein, partial [Actinospica sp.]|nr:extracellular solute-binding protein [Actinospica sp.]
LWFNDDDILKVFKTVVPSFNAKYPQVKLNLVGVDVSTKLAPTLISGTGVPDGSFAADGAVGAQANELYDLSSLMKPHLADTVQYKLDVNTVNGKLVGIPWDTDPGLFFYREDILSAAGVNPAQLTSYEALLDAARAVKGKNPNAQPIPLEQDPGLGMQWLMMLVSQQQGSGLTDANGKLTIDTDAYRNALTWIKTIVDEGLGARCKFASTAQIALADNGTISIVPWAIWFNFLVQTSLPKSSGKWRVQQLPTWKSGGATSGVMGGSSFIIPQKAARPQLAWLFYEHALYSEEGVTQVFGENTVYPPRPRGWPPGPRCAPPSRPRRRTRGGTARSPPSPRPRPCSARPARPRSSSPIAEPARPRSRSTTGPSAPARCSPPAPWPPTVPTAPTGSSSRSRRRTRGTASRQPCCPPNRGPRSSWRSAGPGERRGYGKRDFLRCSGEVPEPGSMATRLRLCGLAKTVTVEPSL